MGGTILPTVMASKEEWQYLGPWVSGRLPWDLCGSQASKSVNSFPGSWVVTEPPCGFPAWEREEGKPTQWLGGCCGLKTSYLVPFIIVFGCGC